jgi:hypothetical protein
MGSEKKKKNKKRKKKKEKGRETERKPMLEVKE